MPNLSPDLEPFLSAILARFPELAGARIEWHTTGWHSVAADVDDRWIFKFPRHPEAERALRREASLLAAVRPAVTMPVPELELLSGTPLFSRHAKLKGAHLVTAQYDRLSERSRQELAVALARFYAELHRLDPREMEARGALPVESWMAADDILRTVRPLLEATDASSPPQMQILPFAERTLARWAALPADPHGSTYGFFDGHGWNMAFDHEAGRLTGVYDFADSGFGPLHQEFIYSNFISTDLTRRIMDEYETFSGRGIDRERVEILTGVHRLWELAAVAADEAQLPAMLASVKAWVGRTQTQ